MKWCLFAKSWVHCPLVINGHSTWNWSCASSFCWSAKFFDRFSQCVWFSENEDALEMRGKWRKTKPDRRCVNVIHLPFSVLFIYLNCMPGDMLPCLSSIMINLFLTKAHTTIVLFCCCNFTSSLLDSNWNPQMKVSHLYNWMTLLHFSLVTLFSDGYDFNKRNPIAKA